MSGAYTSDHPDIQRLHREIASLESQGYGIGADDSRDERISKLQARLLELRENHSEDYPDVVQTKRALEALQKSPPVPAAKPTAKRIRADNPVYLNLRSQIDSDDAEIAALRQQQAVMQRKQTEIETHLEETPQVEREYLELSRDQDNSRARFRELKQKQMDAEVAEQLEHDRKAERFTLIEPPQYPEKPASPNRLAIIMAGFVLALVGGVSFGATPGGTRRHGQRHHRTYSSPPGADLRCGACDSTRLRAAPSGEASGNDRCGDGSRDHRFAGPV